ncbi:MAG: cell division ATP-binding protein FtsE [Armatimonadetes bacterium]|nr:cell division ATP-binding protein FtsE [Armatimonadota bacterium]
MIEFRNVSVEYPNGVHALRGVDLKVEQGEFLFVVGSTGTGKSTLLKLIYREEVPTEGTVTVGGQNVNRLRGGRIPRLRRGIGVVFQDFRLLPDKTAWENVAFALYVIGAPKKQLRSRVAEVLDLVGLLGRSDAYPHQLSGGEQQRIAIARALANKPKVILADEPTGNLDPDTSWEIIQLLDQVNGGGTTMIVASHDQHIVDRLRRRVIRLDNGALVSDEAEGAYHELARS